MNNNANAIESALGRIANMLEGSAEVRSTMPPPVNPPPPPTDLTERAEVSTTRLQSMAATARQHMYLQGMPIFDRARVRTLEEVDVPRVVELLKSLKTKPTLRRDLKEALVRERAKMGDLDKHRERADAMIKALRADMGAGEERLDPITAGLVIGYVALCIAGFMASYTVAHEWDR